ncbi:MAG: hypothetical protein A2Y40_09555 [Candidatus Margulisbacteria bacterium GWF2_35_9]|nr:MAG: hypothetical protein A2Y40_09555 [Candidatus Margulisbacteria bacterium GWF2_35_9]
MNKEKLTAEEVFSMYIGDYINYITTGETLLDKGYTELRKRLIDTQEEKEKFDHIFFSQGLISQYLILSSQVSICFLEAESRLKTILLLSHENEEIDHDLKAIDIIINFLTRAYIFYIAIDLFSKKINKPDLMNIYIQKKQSIEEFSTLFFNMYPSLETFFKSIKTDSSKIMQAKLYVQETPLTNFSLNKVAMILGS